MTEKEDTSKTTAAAVKTPTPAPAAAPAPAPAIAAVAAATPAPAPSAIAATLRDQIAMAALTGLIVREGTSPLRDNWGAFWTTRGKLCYQIADLVLATR